MENWEMAKGYNTQAGFKEWLEAKGARTNAKRQEIADRLMKGEVIVFGQGNWRMRYVMEQGVGVFYTEKRK